MKTGLWPGAPPSGPPPPPRSAEVALEVESVRQLAGVGTAIGRGVEVV
jgi:hypothetical protein